MHVVKSLIIFNQGLLRREPLKLVDEGLSQRTFIYIRDAIEAVLLMIVCINFDLVAGCPCIVFKVTEKLCCLVQENPDRANGHIFNVGNPNNEVTVRQLAEMMTEVSGLS